MANVAAGKIEAAFDGEMSFVFDLLGDDFTEDELFGEIFGADDDAVSARRTAGREKEQRGKRASQPSQRARRADHSVNLIPSLVCQCDTPPAALRQHANPVTTQL